MYNKSEIMKNAWFYFKKGWYNKDFSVCLKKAWNKAKSKVVENIIAINADIAKETEKAIQLKTDLGYVWIPKTAIKAINVAKTVVLIKEWFINSLDSNKKYALMSA